MGKSDIITNQFVKISQTSASIGERIVARLIDYAIIALYTIAMVLIIDAAPTANSSWSFVMAFLFTMPIWFYDFLWEAFNNGQSPGKYIMKTRVINKDGSRPSLGSFFMRWLLSFVDIGVSGVGLLVILLTKHSQRLGDLAAGTMVIKLVDYTKYHVTLDEFYYVKKDYHPIYEEAKNLSQGQVELIEKTLYSTRDDHDYQIEVLANKVEKFLGIQSKENSKETFLATIIHDYQYYAMELI